MADPVKLHIGLTPQAAQALRDLPAEARGAWVEAHVHAQPLGFESFETYGFLSCTIEAEAALPRVEAAPEVDWVELDSPMKAI